MNWQSPSLLLALWLVPLIGIVGWYARRKTLAAAAHFASERMLGRLAPRLPASRHWLKIVMLMSAFSCLTFAIARPQFGVYFEDVTSRGVDLFVVLDVSRSMLAEDVAPNRLERSKSDILDLLDRLTDDRVGLIAFAGSPSVVVPLTTDHGFFRMVLRDLDTDAVPKGGSLMGDAIRRALDAMPQQADRDQFIVLITDGEDQESFPEDAAKRAAERDVRIITVGIGDTTQGARIPKQSEGGGLGFVRYEGQEVWSVMDEPLLKSIALTTSGAYVPARTRSYDLGKIYDDRIAGRSKTELTEEKRRRYRERFQLFAAVGLILMLIESMILPTRRAETNVEEMMA